MSELCPKCNIELVRNLSKPGMVGRCKKCEKISRKVKDV